MARCEVCGNEYDKSFEVIAHDGVRHVFDSIECAASLLAPQCSHCGCRILGHGLESGGEFFCCAHCATHAGKSGLRDRVEAA